MEERRDHPPLIYLERGSLFEHVLTPVILAAITHSLTSWLNESPAPITLHLSYFCVDSEFLIVELIILATCAQKLHSF